MKYLIWLFRNTATEWLRSNSYTGKNLHDELNCKLMWCKKNPQTIYSESLDTQGIFANLFNYLCVNTLFLCKIVSYIIDIKFVSSKYF